MPKNGICFASTVAME